MKKAIKKIATIVASMSMVAAMGVSAFAADTYQFVGNPNLLGNADRNTEEVGWQYLNEDQFFAEPDALEGIYTYKATYVKASDYDELSAVDKGKSRQFKILADGPDFAWNYQMCFGVPEAAWADNQTQFEVIESSIEEGEYSVYMDPAKGYVCLIQNGKNVDLLARYHSRDEDSWHFVGMKKDDIIADGYDAGSVYVDDAAYLEFVNKCLANEGGEAITALYNGEAAPAYDGSVDGNGELLAPSTSSAGGEDTTVEPAAEDTTDDSSNEPAQAETTKEKKEDKGTSPVLIVVIVVVVVAVICAVVAFTKKKN